MPGSGMNNAPGELMSRAHSSASSMARASWRSSSVGIGRSVCAIRSTSTVAAASTTIPAKRAVRGQISRAATIAVAMTTRRLMPE
jgi:hypothetical protein